MYFYVISFVFACTFTPADLARQLGSTEYLHGLPEIVSHIKPPLENNVDAKKTIEQQLKATAVNEADALAI